MYEYVIYKNRQGKDEISEYIERLGKKAQTSKTARIKLKKILEYLDILVTYGTHAGEPYIKHLDGDIWELRPIDDRILYAYWKDNTFVLLHLFKKTTQKTPQRELDQAKRNLKDWIERADI